MGKSNMIRVGRALSGRFGLFMFGASAAPKLLGMPVARLISPILFSVYLGPVMWGGLWLRDARFRALFPVRP